MENKSELIEFAKWFVHSRRKKNNQTDIVWFASGLMVELCANHPFESKHRVLVEWDKYKEENDLKF